MQRCISIVIEETHDGAPERLTLEFDDGNEIVTHTYIPEESKTAIALEASDVNGAALSHLLICSQCGSELPYLTHLESDKSLTYTPSYPHCPYCGAKMDMTTHPASNW